MNRKLSDQTLPRVSGVILAGGQSRRIGRDKAFLDLEGSTLIERVIEQVRKVCSEVIIVANDREAYAPFDARVVGDAFLGKGPLGGIFSGLQAAQEEYALAVACDMPFLNDALLRYLISLVPQADVIIPRAQDPSGNPARDQPAKSRSKPLAKESELHPLHAVYSKTCLEPMRRRLLADDLRLISFHDAVAVRIVEPEQVDRFDPLHWSFFNINTPEDLERAHALKLKNQPALADS